MGRQPLPSSFYARPATDVARDLIGCVLVSCLGGARTAGRVVETEAYTGAEDLASHAARLRTGRVLSMRGAVGVTYVYRSYGIHAMLNVVAHAAGGTGAVLIRAVRPGEGVETMRERRGGVADRLLCAGPGRLCQAMGIALDDHGIDVSGSGPLLILGRGNDDRPAVLASGRIGISRATNLPWRYFESGSPFVSAHRRGVPADDHPGILAAP